MKVLSVILLVLNLFSCGGGGVDLPPEPIELIANAGTDQQVSRDIEFTLDGSDSFSPIPGSLIFNWKINTAPDGSNAQLSDITAVQPTFTPDKEGVYEIELVVFDEDNNRSESDTIIINAINNAPVAKVGNAFHFAINSMVELDGSASIDENGDELSYLWTLISKPEGSLSELTNANSSNPSFTPDSVGEYEIKLIVIDDHNGSSDPVSIKVTVLAPVVSMKNGFITEDFENDLKDWEFDNEIWNVGLRSDTSLLGKNTIGVVLTSEFPEGKSTRLVTPEIGLVKLDTETQKVFLKFWYLYALNEQCDEPDYARILIASESDADVWNEIKQYSGNSGSWLKESIDLSVYSGQNVRIAFEINNSTSCTNDVNTLTGWFIDELIVLSNETDDVPPVTTASLKGSTVPVFGGQKITLNCEDINGSGCAAVYYTLDGNDPSVNSKLYEPESTITLLSDTLKYFSIDHAGNQEVVQTETYEIKPLDLNLKFEVNRFHFNWVSYGSATTYVIFQSLDGSEEYKQIGKIQATTEIKLDIVEKELIEARYRLEAYNSKNQLLVTSDPITLKEFDGIAPVTVANPDESTAPIFGGKEIILDCTDVDGSGCATIYYTLDGSKATIAGNVYTSPIQLFNETTLKYFSVDRVGNSESEKSAFYTIVPLELKVDFGLKQLKFSWNEYGNGVTYRVLENADGATGYLPIEKNITSAFFSKYIAVHKQDWDNASYMVEAYNSSNTLIAESKIVDVKGGDLKTIGYFKASNTDAGDEFGTSVSISADGNILVIGAPGEDSGTIREYDAIADVYDNVRSAAGAVYIYTRNSGAGTWHSDHYDYVKASNIESDDSFGKSVSISADGNTLVVGATGEDSAAKGVNDSSVGSSDNSASSAGAVYVYTRANNASEWDSQDYIKASNTEAGDGFGNSVSLSENGNTLAVGAARKDSSAGAVYVYTRESNTSIWNAPDYIKASKADAFDGFGASLSLSANGNTLVVGADGEDSVATGIDNTAVGSGDNSISGAGAVYVYIRDNNTSPWNQLNYIKASSTNADDNFGASVSLSADAKTLAVGAPGAKGVTNGLIYVFTRTNNTSIWSAPDVLDSIDLGFKNLNFGRSLSLSADGNTLAVGHIEEDSAAIGVNDTTVGSSDRSEEQSGAVYVYTREKNTSLWNYPPDYIKASNTNTNDWFGFSVSVSADGNTLAVGAHWEDSVATGVNENSAGGNDNSAENAGSVYLY